MIKTAKNILTLNHEEVMDFFMKSEQCHEFELPEKKETSSYSLRLCLLVVGKEIQPLWTNGWTTSDMYKKLPTIPFSIK